MLNFGLDSIEQVKWGATTIGYIRWGYTLIWEAIRSCFGKGYWINNKEWSNKDAWKN